MKNKYKISSWFPVILWMSIIFFLSSQVADESSQLSSGITAFVMNLMEKIIPKTIFDLEFLHFLVRKNAHFIAYLILGLLSLRAFKREGLTGVPLFSLSLLICVLYASSDEYHQLFVPGRSCQLRDVLIDSAGATTGLLIVKGISGLRKRKSNPVTQQE